MNFSDKIKFQREQNHLTQKELAELVGVSQRAIAAYESSGTIARISTMRKLAHALNVSYDYLKHDEITDPSYGIEKMDYMSITPQSSILDFFISLFIINSFILNGL